MAFSSSFRTRPFLTVVVAFCGFATFAFIPRRLAFMVFFMATFAFIGNFLPGGLVNSTLPLMRPDFVGIRGVCGSSSSRRPAVHEAAIFVNLSFPVDLADLFGEPRVDMIVRSGSTRVV